MSAVRVRLAEPGTSSWPSGGREVAARSPHGRRRHVGHAIVMGLINGRTLEALVEKEAPLPLARAAAIAEGILEAVGHVHERHVVWRDLTPGNVMLAGPRGPPRHWPAVGRRLQVDMASECTGPAVEMGAMIVCRRA